ncbi:MAG: glycosyltransferase [Thiobacillaceae bacterium]|jgi:glycosyltransferase involved in cell wall biosynthesis|nr:glycosyltransferase [Thiobacillaceae bacterium]
MRVLMLSDVYFPRVNGVSTSIETFRNRLPDQGVEVRLVAPTYGTEPAEAGIIRVPGRAVPGDREDRLVRYRAMRRAAREAAADCDLIHVQTPFAAHYAGLAAGRERAIPVIATYHTLFEDYLQHYVPLLPAGWLRGIARRLSRSQCEALDAVIAPSGAMRDRLRRYGVTRPIHVLPTGIPLGRYTAGDGERFRTGLGIAPNRPVALYVGRVAHEKNLSFLLEAVDQARRQVPDLLLLVTGEGPAMADLQDRVRRQGLSDHVRFLGYLERRGALPDCYAAADAFVFASRTETQGLVLLEAMASGLPVVALSAMGTADILGQGRGCLVPADRVEAFAQAVAIVLGNPALRRKLGQEAREYAAEWSDDALARRLADLYRAVIAEVGAARAAGQAAAQGQSGS